MKNYLPEELSTPLPDIFEADDLLFHAVIDRVTPVSAVNSLYELIHRPIIAFDTSFRLIAFAFPRPFCFAPWEELASTEILSDSYIYENNSLFFQEKMYHLRRSSYFNREVSIEYPQVDGPILSNGTLIGYAGICVANDDEVEDMIYINDRLSEALALLVPLYNNDMGSIAQKGLWEHFLNPGMIDAAEASLIEQYTPPAYRIAVLAAENGQIPTMKYIKSCLDKRGFSIQTYIDRNDQLLVLYYDLQNVSQKESEKIIMEQLEDFTEKYQLYGGLSDSFYHLIDSPAAKLQADISIEIGSRNSHAHHVFSFRRLYRDMICGYAIERYGLYPNIPPVLRNDKMVKKIFPLLPTLEAFLVSDCKQDKAAAALGVHKNTVANRLKQFTEITGADPADPAVILQIKLGLMLHRYSLENRKSIGKGGRD